MQALNLLTFIWFIIYHLSSPPSPPGSLCGWGWGHWGRCKKHLKNGVKTELSAPLRVSGVGTCQPEDNIFVRAAAGARRPHSCLLGSAKQTDENRIKAEGSTILGKSRGKKRFLEDLNSVWPKRICCHFKKNPFILLFGKDQGWDVL